MTIIDRYLFWMFLKIFLVCFVSFTGLFVVVHLFSNLDELTALSKIAGWGSLARDFYIPRVAEVFDKTAAVWALVAAVFSINLMQRRREMTAVEAAGIAKSRILRPVLICSVVIVGLAVANRELVIPQFKDRLVRTAQNWDDQESLPMGVYHDLKTGVKIRGQKLSLPENKITQVEVQLPAIEEASSLYFNAAWATVPAKDQKRPYGLLLHQVSLPEGQSVQPTLKHDGRSVILWPPEMESLAADQCFVNCDFDAYQMAYGKKLETYHSVQEMMAALRKPRMWFGRDLQINVHARLLRPVLELTLLMLGLPLAIRRLDRNIFVSAGICFLVVGGLQLSIIVSHSLGSYSVIKPAALAAWLPVIAFLPPAIVMMRRIDG